MSHQNEKTTRIGVVLVAESFEKASSSQTIITPVAADNLGRLNRNNRDVNNGLHDALSFDDSIMSGN